MKLLKSPIVKISVSILLFVVIFSQIDLSELIENFRKLDLWFVPLLIVLLIANYVISSFRWKSLLIFQNSDKVSVKYLTQLYFIGAFFNNFMPTSIGGDVYKALKLGSKLDNKTNAISATFMERFSGVITLVLISYVGLVKTFDFWMSLLPAFIKDNFVLYTLLQLGVFLGFWVGGAMGFVALKMLSDKSKKFKGFYDALLLYKKEHRVLVIAFLSSVVVQLLAIFTQYFIFSALGVTLPLFYALFIFPMITLASFFIPSLNGVGVQDTLYIQLFMVVGVSLELALTASILYHMFRLLVSLIGGLIYAVGKDF